MGRGVGLEKVNFFYFEPKIKIDFFFGRRRGGLEQVNYFFTENPIFFFGGGGLGTGWRTGGGGGGLVDGQTNRPKPSSVTLAFNLGKKMFELLLEDSNFAKLF